MNIFGYEDIFENPVLFFAFLFFSCKENRQGCNDTLAFPSSLRFLTKEKQFFGTNVFFGPVFCVEKKTRL